MSLEMSWCNALLILRLGQRDTHPINLVGQGFPSLKRPSWNVLANLGSALILPSVGQPTSPIMIFKSPALLPSVGQPTSPLMSFNLTNFTVWIVTSFMLLRKLPSGCLLEDDSWTSALRAAVALILSLTPSLS